MPEKDSSEFFVKNTSNTNDDADLPFVMDGIRSMKFYSLLTLQILSVFCSLFLLYHFLFDRLIRQVLYNHLIIALLFVSLLTCTIDLPLILFHLKVNVTPLSNGRFCLFWNYVDLSFYALISLLMLWTSIERYLFIYHSPCFQRRSLICFSHRLPLLLIPLYVSLFYSVAILIHPCENHFDFTQVVCGELCYYSQTPWLAVIDQWLNNILPALFIAVLNLFLFVRVIWQKRRRPGRSLSWQRHRRMVLQLLPVTLLYLAGVLPYGFVTCASLLGFSSQASLTLQGHFFYLFYYVAVLLPFVSLIGMPNIYSKILPKRTPQIYPTVI